MLFVYGLVVRNHVRPRGRATPAQAFATAAGRGVHGGGPHRVSNHRKGSTMIGIILLVLLVLLLLGVLPTWGYSRNWSYGPSGGLGLLLVIVLIAWLIYRF